MLNRSRFLIRPTPSYIPPGLHVGAPGTLNLDVGNDPGPDEDPDPNFGYYGGTEASGYKADVQYSFTGDGFSNRSGYSYSYLTISNTPGGDSVDMWAEAPDFDTAVGLLFTDLSGNALTSGAWTQQYTRARWQTIAFSFWGDTSTGYNYTYEARIPVVEAGTLGCGGEIRSVLGDFL